jgi:hypothetical protein
VAPLSAPVSKRFQGEPLQDRPVANVTFLKQDCLAYHDIRIDADALSQLPEDGNVLGDILTMDDDLDGSDAGDSGLRGVGRQ